MKNAEELLLRLPDKEERSNRMEERWSRRRDEHKGLSVSLHKCPLLLETSGGQTRCLALKLWGVGLAGDGSPWIPAPPQLHFNQEANRAAHYLETSLDDDEGQKKKNPAKNKPRQLISVSSFTFPQCAGSVCKV